MRLRILALLTIALLALLSQPALAGGCGPYPVGC